MPRGNFEFKYTVPEGNAYPKNGLLRTYNKSGNTFLFYGRRLSDKEIAKYGMTEHTKRFGKLTTLREQAGKKQTEMAEACGIAYRSLQRYELSGVEQMTVGMALKIAKYLKCSVEDLVDDPS